MPYCATVCFNNCLVYFFTRQNSNMWYSYLCYSLAPPPLTHCDPSWVVLWKLTLRVSKLSIGWSLRESQKKSQFDGILFLLSQWFSLIGWRWQYVNRKIPSHCIHGNGSNSIPCGGTGSRKASRGCGMKQLWTMTYQELKVQLPPYRHWKGEGTTWSHWRWHACGRYRHSCPQTCFLVVVQHATIRGGLYEG
jgi:hypothetical protein